MPDRHGRCQRRCRRAPVVINRSDRGNIKAIYHGAAEQHPPIQHTPSSSMVALGD